MKYAIVYKGNTELFDSLKDATKEAKRLVENNYTNTCTVCSYNEEDEETVRKSAELGEAVCMKEVERFFI